MVKKKGDLSLTVVQLPALYPTLDIISQISPVSHGNTVCLNIAHPTSSSLFKQVDVYEQCVSKKQPLSSNVPDNTNTVIINNLSFWILYCGIQRVYQELLQMSRQYKVISSIIHNTLDPDTEDTILLLPDIIVSLSPSPDNPLFGTYLEVVRQTTGRTEKRAQHYTLVTCESGTGHKLHISPIQEKPVVPLENTKCDVTFELGLSSKEKSARAATELPYTAAAVQSVPENSEADEQVAGEIHYVPDEQDDWDDEDPDDDLDI